MLRGDDRHAHILGRVVVPVVGWRRHRVPVGGRPGAGAVPYALGPRGRRRAPGDGGGAGGDAAILLRYFTGYDYLFINHCINSNYW